MNIPGLLIALLIGAICGWLAGQLVKGGGFGAVLFGFLFGNFNLLSSPMLNEIAGGTIGAVILLLIISFVKKAT
jgi:uncharacterized membrane protein YeaQ/YmgE (transglycosylase-associated protein family)